MKSELRIDIPGLDKALRDKAFADGAVGGAAVGFLVGVVLTLLLLKVFGRMK